MLCSLVLFVGSATAFCPQGIWCGHPGISQRSRAGVAVVQMAQEPPPKEVQKKLESKGGKKAETKAEPEASTILDFGAAIFGAAVDATVWAGTAIAEEGVKVLAEPMVAAEAAAMPKEQAEKEAAPEKVPEKVSAKVSAMDDTRAFIPTPKFAGPKKNFVFKAGPEGVGYYNRDYTWE